MGFLSDINRSRKKATKKILNPFVKGISKVSDKLIPNELRFAMPYAAGIGTIALPPGWGPYMRALAAGGINVAGQIAADETPIEDISDINKFSVALASGLGAAGSDQFASNMRSGIEGGAGPWTMEGVEQAPVGFMQGAENVTREGLASLGDYVTGTRETLANLGQHPGELMSLGGAKDALTALGPTISHGTGDVAYETSIDYKDAADRLRAEEEAEIAETTTADETKRATLQMTFMRQAGHDEETIKETLAQNNLEDYYEEPVPAAQGGRIGYGIGGWLKSKLGMGQQEGTAYASGNRAAQDPEVLREKLLAYFKNKYSGDDEGGIIGLKHGGMLNLGGNEMDYRGGGFVPIGKKERADDVPARLSKNEFVMTADAVKAAGGGNVNKGAQRMYNVMNNLEARA